MGAIITLSAHTLSTIRRAKIYGKSLVVMTQQYQHIQSRKKKWEIKARKAIYVLFVIAEHEFLHWIKDYKKPIEAWGILETLSTT